MRQSHHTRIFTTSHNVRKFKQTKNEKKSLNVVRVILVRYSIRTLMVHGGIHLSLSAIYLSLSANLEYPELFCFLVENFCVKITYLITPFRIRRIIHVQSELKERNYAKIST